ncbi:Protein kinase superfamily protein [Forsythia ovata]|uniref:non-specific serine/threonine protein kinase n=1 Tax=Forsythia ovata TaxID=205694 RepID=A0ABD1WQU8_9LAMI
MSKRRLLCAGFSFLILFLCYTTSCQAQNNSFCVPSSCGDISIRYPFRLKADPENCGHTEPIFTLECQKNSTILSSKSQRYNVLAINYNNFTIRIADPGLDRDNSSSCPIYSSVDNDLSSSYMYLASSQSVTLLNYISLINNSLYIENPYCGNKSTFSNSSNILSYFVIGSILGSDLEESCTFDTVVLTSSSIPLQENAMYSTIQVALAFGFEIYWYRAMCGECDASKGTCIVEDNQIRCRHYCYEDTPLSERTLRYDTYQVDDETIEEYLKHQDNLMPIKYSYSEIKKMTKSFKDKLGGGRCGTVFKGNLRSGPFVAIKMMAILLQAAKNLSMKLQKLEGFVHANVVKLIGFCIEGSKRALVYEFMPNGSPDKYVYSREGTVLLELRKNI